MKVSSRLSILYFTSVLYCDLCSRGSFLYPMVLIFIYFKLLPKKQPIVRDFGDSIFATMHISILKKRTPEFLFKISNF